jgi:hypothetical protein
MTPFKVNYFCFMFPRKVIVGIPGVIISTNLEGAYE